MKTIKVSFLTLAALFLLSSSVVFSQQKSDCATTAFGCLGQPRPMTLAIAKQIVAAAFKASCPPPKACTGTGSMAVVDDAGTLIYLETLDGTIAGVPQLTIEKAQTAAIWRRRTTVFRDSVLKGVNPAYAQSNFPYMTLSPGGVPLFVNGRCVGAFAHGGVGDEGMKIMEDAAIDAAAKLFGNK